MIKYTDGSTSDSASYSPMMSKFVNAWPSSNKWGLLVNKHASREISTSSSCELDWWLIQQHEGLT